MIEKRNSIQTGTKNAKTTSGNAVVLVKWTSHQVRKIRNSGDIGVTGEMGQVFGIDADGHRYIGKSYKSMRLCDGDAPAAKKVDRELQR